MKENTSDSVSAAEEARIGIVKPLSAEGVPRKSVSSMQRKVSINSTATSEHSSRCVDVGPCSCVSVSPCDVVEVCMLVHAGVLHVLCPRVLS